ncbi:MAG: hypothetical protein V1777_01700 [Candidatus Micrarchaeota archaeon]
MNQNGNLLLYYILIAVVLVAISMVVLILVPQAQIVMGIVLSFAIFMNVRGSIGDGMPTIIISAILIYFLVFKYFLIASGFYLLTILLAFGGASLITWFARFLFWKGE